MNRYRGLIVSTFICFLLGSLTGCGPYQYNFEDSQLGKSNNSQVSSETQPISSENGIADAEKVDKPSNVTGSYLTAKLSEEGANSKLNLALIDKSTGSPLVLRPGQTITWAWKLNLTLVSSFNLDTTYPTLVFAGNDADVINEIKNSTVSYTLTSEGKSESRSTVVDALLETAITNDKSTVGLNQRTLTLKVLNGWNYLTHFVVDGQQISHPDSTIVYSEGFYNHTTGDWHESNMPGATASYTFEGATVELYGLGFSYGGTGEIYVDGVYQQSVNFFNAVDGTAIKLFEIK